MLKLYNKWRLLFFYVNTLKVHIADINDYFINNDKKNNYSIIDIKLDKVYRLYTVVNFNADVVNNVKTYGTSFLDNEIKKFIKDLNEQLKKYGLFELVGLSKAEQISDSSIHLVVEYKLLKTTKIARNIIWGLLASMMLTILYFVYS